MLKVRIIIHNLICKNIYEFNGDFTQYSNVGVGSGVTSDDDIINFKFTNSQDQNNKFSKRVLSGTV